MKEKTAYCSLLNPEDGSDIFIHPKFQLTSNRLHGINLPNTGFFKTVIVGTANTTFLIPHKHNMTNTGCGKLTSFFEYEYTHIKKEVSLPHPVQSRSLSSGV
jgi:hypothetical protein